MVYNIKMGIVAGAGIAGTAISTFSSKVGNGQNQSGGNDKNTKYGNYHPPQQIQTNTDHTATYLFFTTKPQLYSQIHFTWQSTIQDFF